MIAELEFAGTALVAPVLGAAIGMERRWRQRMAGAGGAGEGSRHPGKGAMKKTRHSFVLGL